jgi:hypothetical protein
VGSGVNIEEKIIFKEILMAKKTVDEYISGLEGWQAEVVTSLRKIVKEAVPDASEAVKWAQPVYDFHGPFAYIRAFKNHVNFGFWRGASLDDPQGLLQGDGEKMRHIKLTGQAEVKPDIFKNFVQQAVRLNETLGDPTKGS